MTHLLLFPLFLLHFQWIDRLIMHLCFKYVRNESLLIEEIIKDILNKLLSTSIGYTKNLVGIDADIQEIEMRLCLESNDVRMVGI